MALAIGIDLGTTNSCVAVVRDGKARVVQDERGVALQPSVVSFHPDGRVLVGTEANDRRVIDPQNTFYSVKRLIGRDFTDDEVQRVAERYPYEVAKGPKGIPLARARGKEYTLPEISSMVLGHLRDIAEATLGEEAGGVVITVPANFNDVQRSSTRVSGRIAGLDVQRILNEPTAAALAYGYGQGLNERVAVYDFGGGTFDITILDLRDNVFEVMATAGDMFLGGDDLDSRIVDHMVASFLQLHHVDIRDNPIALQRLRGVAEQIKKQLSSRAQVSARIRELEYGPGGKPLDMNYSITRDGFEQRVEDLIDRSFMVCDEAFRLASLSPAQLDNVILVGGTTRVPLVRQRVAEYFGITPRADINPDEVVAIGAAIQAFALSGQQQTQTTSIPKAQDPASLGRPIGATPKSINFDSSGGTQPGVGTNGPGGAPASTLMGMPAQQQNKPSAAAAAFGGGLPDDLPAPRGARPAQQGFGEPGTEVTEQEEGGPTQTSTPPPGALPSGPAAAAAFGEGLPDDLPAPRSARPSRPAPTGGGIGGADLPAPAGGGYGGADLPAPAGGGYGGADLPAPAGGGYGGADLPAPAGGGQGRTDLPAPAGGGYGSPDLPAPAAGGQGGSNLPAPAAPQGAAPGRGLQAPTSGAAAAFGGGVPEDLPTPQRPSGPSRTDLPSPVGHQTGAAAAFGGQVPEDLPTPQGVAGASQPPPPPAPSTPDLPIPQGQGWQGGGQPPQQPYPPQQPQQPPARSHSQPPPKPGSITGSAAAAFGGQVPEDLPTPQAAEGSWPGAGSFGTGQAPSGISFSEESVIGSFTEEVKAPASIGRPPPGVMDSSSPSSPAPLSSAGAAGSEAASGRSGLAFGEFDFGGEPESASPLDLDDEERGEFDVLSSPGAPQPQITPLPVEYVESAVDLAPAQAIPQPGMAGVQAPGVAPLPSNVMQEMGINHILIDVTPRTLAVQTVQGYCDPIIERNSPIPIEQTRTFTTSRDDQTVVIIRICQGESRRVEENTVLGEVALSEIRAAPRGDVKIAVTFEIDTDGVVAVNARDVDTGQQAVTKVSLFGGMSDDEVRDLVKRYGR